MVLAGALCLAAAVPLPALDLQRRFSQFRLARWGTHNGLPSQRVNAIAETRDGYLWFGTYSGLARFDGVRFTIFDPGNSPLPRNEILALLAASDGSLWIGTSGGAVHYDHGRFVSIAAPGGGGDAAVVSVAESGGRIWLAYNGLGLYYMEGAQPRAVALSPEVRRGVRALARDSGGGVLAATDQGVLRVARNLGEELLDGAATLSVRSVLQMPDGTLWAGSREHGLMRRTPGGTWEMVTIPRNRPRGRI